MINEKILEKIVLVIIFAFGLYMMYSAAKTPMLGEDEVRITYIKDIVEGKLFPQTFAIAISSLLVYTAYDIPLYLFSLNALVISHIFTAFLTMLLLLVMYLIGKKSEHMYFGMLCVLFLISIPLLFHLSLFAYIDGAIALFSALAFFAIIKWYRKPTLLNLLFVILLSGLSFYTKESGLLITLLAFLFVAAISVRKNDYKNIFIFLAATIIIFSPYILRNIIIFGFPGMEGLNIFFKIRPADAVPQWVFEAAKMIIPQKPSFITLLSMFALPHILLFFTASVLIIIEKRTEYIFSLLLIILFISVFIYSYISSTRLLENRYFTIIFPQIAFLGSFTIYQLVKTKKVIHLIIAAFFVLLLLFYSINTFSIIKSTSESVRYTPEYLSALKWLKDNTPSDAKVFTTYGGSLKVYGERDSVWAIEEFPQLMRGTNSSYDYEVLKKYNVSYILIWVATIGRDYIIPESNIIGAYTPTFINTIAQDTERFEKVFENKETLIFKIL